MLDGLINIYTKPVRQSAARYGGHCTWHFSQMKNPVRGVIGKSGTTNKGICEILAAKWVIEHARGGSLVEWLSGGSTSRHDINIPRLAVLAQTFGLGRDDQDTTTDAYYRSAGMLPRRKSRSIMTYRGKVASSAPIHDMEHGLGRHDAAPALARYVKKTFGAYIHLSIAGGMAAHALALWVERDVAFFDPNFGEFWFEDRDDFCRWLPEFYRRSLYNRTMGSSIDLKQYAMSTETAKKLESGGSRLSL